MKTTVNAYAKINLALRVLDKNEQGYHNLDMIVSSINLFDTICVERLGNAGKKQSEGILGARNKEKATKEVKDEDIQVCFYSKTEYVDVEKIHPTNNTVVKAVRLFINEFGSRAYKISITKNIPLLGGIGGSSADAAGVLNALCELEGIAKTDKRIESIALKCGSDVKCMMNTGFKRVSGTGETVKQIPSNSHFFVLLAGDKAGVSTADCYNEFDKQMGITETKENEKAKDKGDEKAKDNQSNEKAKEDKTASIRPLMSLLYERNPIRAVLKNDVLEELIKKNCRVNSIRGFVSNDLQLPAESLNPEVGNTLDFLNQEFNDVFGMSGSGSICFKLFDTEKEAFCEYLRIKDKVDIAILTETI